MLVPFVIESDAVSGEQHWNALELRSHQISLIRAWQRIGMLIFDGDFLSTCALKARFDTITDGHVQGGIWKGFVERAPSAAGGASWAGILEASSIGSLAEIARVCVTTKTNLEALDGAARSALLELQPLFNAANARTFREAERRSHSHIQAGASASDVWTERFKSLASATNPGLKQVFVIDAYAVQRQIVDGLPDLLNFMRHLGSSASSRKNVTIFSDWPYEQNMASGKSIRMSKPAIVRYFHDLRGDLNSPWIGSLTLRLFHGRNRQRDRFVMFGDNYAWDLGHGLEPFEKESVEKWCSATLKTWDNAETYRGIVESITVETEAIEIWR